MESADSQQVTDHIAHNTGGYVGVCPGTTGELRWRYDVGYGRGMPWDDR